MTQEEKLTHIEQGLERLRDTAKELATGEAFPGRKKATRIWFGLKALVPPPASESKFRPDNDPGPYYQPAQADGDGVEWDLGEEVETEVVMTEEEVFTENKVVRVTIFEDVKDFVSKKPNAENFDIEAVSLSFFEFLLSAGPRKTLDEHWSDFESVVANSECETAENAGENEAEAAQQGEGEAADAQTETQATTEPTTKKNGKK